jgi:flagellar biosynthesis/type III secretory pathway ATPase
MTGAEKYKDKGREIILFMDSVNICVYDSSVGIVLGYGLDDRGSTV